MAEVRQRSSRGIDATKGMEGNKEMEVNKRRLDDEVNN
jgi:hypothetical protein